MTVDNTTEDERRLVERAIARDRDAFGALYERHVFRVYRHLYYMVGQEAEDLTAETFLRAWKAIDRYEVRGIPIISWLLRIAHNEGVNYLRSRRQTKPLPEALADSASARNPEAATERRLAVANVKRAILNLGEVQRQVLSLRLMEEQDYRDVAAQVGMSVPAVRVIKHRGLQNVRNRVREAV